MSRIDKCIIFLQNDSLFEIRYSDSRSDVTKVCVSYYGSATLSCFLFLLKEVILDIYAYLLSGTDTSPIYKICKLREGFQSCNLTLPRCRTTHVNVGLCNLSIVSIQVVVFCSYFFVFLSV